MMHVYVKHNPKSIVALCLPLAAEMILVCFLLSFFFCPIQEIRLIHSCLQTEDFIAHRAERGYHTGCLKYVRLRHEG